MPKDEELGLFTGGIFTTDNINHVFQTEHASSKSQPKVYNMTSNAFIHNRISQPMQDVLSPPKYATASEVPMTAYLPTELDMDLIKRDHLHLIRRMLVKHMMYFKPLQNDTSIQWYIQHPYSEQSTQKSKILSLGILDINQSTTNGTKEILNYINKYFPQRGQRKLPMVVEGDALTVKMITTTMNHLCNSDPKDDKLDGPCPGLGQFHLRVR
jgi:hypothetical protein